MKKIIIFIKTILLETRLLFSSYKQEFVIVTGSDSSHFKSLYQLLESLNKHESKTKVIVYDLGLEKFEKEKIEANFLKIELREFDYSKYPNYLNIKVNAGEYAWKPVIIDKVLNEFKCSVCWIDAGNIITKPLIKIRKVLELYGFYSPFSKGVISDWTHPKSLENLGVLSDVKLLKQVNLNGACVCANYNNLKVKDVIHKWKVGALNKNCIAPDGSSRANHRQDQAILSVLVYKFIPEIGKKMTYKRFGFKIHQDVD
ncbi:DUF1647 domain-containing protein [Polaribacter glomeratus]|uniref:Uncharacterized protein n=1 Tax=Polaribacter glomeratus TaxID=102 RepID=A0A2S7WV00_9FLAO|nr:DUF1647 domain-containing protein [Polaribacter glomeratus]PQJ81423.1 hypothetical protein BTO16_01995 [Polaribacter glomeratus]TXD64776.1 DUF1647 domain-containing protein [Polaribacter glomeratus]